MTTKKNDDDEDEHNKPTSEIEQSISLSNSEFQLPTEDLKKKFKLDSLVEMKLNKILNKWAGYPLRKLSEWVKFNIIF